MATVRFSDWAVISQKLCLSLTVYHDVWMVYKASGFLSNSNTRRLQVLTTGSLQDFLADKKNDNFKTVD